MASSIEAVSPGTPLEQTVGRERSGFGPVGAGVVLAVLVCLFYNAYRYPLRINDSITSPTYSDTPMSLQIGKYALIGVVAYLVVTIGSLQLRGRIFSASRQGLLLLLLGWSAGLAIYHGMHSGSMLSLSTIAPVGAIVPIAVFGAGWMATVDRVERIGKLFASMFAAMVVLHTIANLAEIWLWRTTGRLPALGYAGGFVRFGGVWDDPNQCATFSALFLVLLASGRLKLNRGVKIILGMAALFNVGVAISYSAFVVLYVGLVTVWIIRSRNRLVVAYAAMAVIAGTALALPTIVQSASQEGVIRKIIEQKKAGSIELRLRTLQERGAGTLPESVGGWIAGEDLPKHSETAFVLWLNATGLVGVTLFTLWILGGLAMLVRSPERVWALPISVALLAGSVLVPYTVIFPLGPLHVLMIALLAGLEAQRRAAGAVVVSSEEQHQS